MFKYSLTETTATGAAQSGVGSYATVQDAKDAATLYGIRNYKITNTETGERTFYGPNWTTTTYTKDGGQRPGEQDEVLF